MACWAVEPPSRFSCFNAVGASGAPGLTCNRVSQTEITRLVCDTETDKLTCYCETEGRREPERILGLAGLRLVARRSACAFPSVVRFWYGSGPRLTGLEWLDPRRPGCGNSSIATQERETANFDGVRLIRST
jgi:hypothetical protein